MHLPQQFRIPAACFLLFACIFLNPPARGQTAYLPVGAGSGGMAGASAAIKNNWAAFNNPANLYSIEKFTAGVNYENRFLIRELGISSLTAALPTGYGVFGLAYNQFGSKLYSQSFFGLAYGRSFGKRIHAGVRLDALHTRLAEDYGRRTNVSFALGFSANLTSDLTMGGVVFNPLLRMKSAKDFNENLPAIYRAGLCYRVEKNLDITVEAEKDMRYKPVLRAGIEYRVKEIATVRAGIGTNPMNHAFGFGFNFGSFIFDIATVRHEVLGYSPQASVIWVSK